MEVGSEDRVIVLRMFSFLFLSLRTPEELRGTEGWRRLSLISTVLSNEQLNSAWLEGQKINSVL